MCCTGNTRRLRPTEGAKHLHNRQLDILLVRLHHTVAAWLKIMRHVLCVAAGHTFETTQREQAIECASRHVKMVCRLKKPFLSIRC
jgi:hypothetical protein